jgi:hypothetical protein
MGLFNAGLAVWLVIAPWTVNSHLRGVLARLGLRGRVRVRVSACGNGPAGPGQAEAELSRCGVSSPGRTSPDS